MSEGWLERRITRFSVALPLAEAPVPFPEVQVTLPTAAGPLPLAGTIAWVKSPARQKWARPIRHGVRFTALNWSSALALARLLTEPPGTRRPSSSGIRATPP